MDNFSQRELELATKIRGVTGKRLRTCIFCVRYHHGNFEKALAMCSGESTSEGDRQS